MKTFFQKIGAFVLATLILVATTSFSVRMHYCGTHLVSVSLNQAAKKCYKPNNLTSSVSFSAAKKACCHDTEFIKTAEDDFKTSEQASISFDDNFILAPNPIFEYSSEVPFSPSDDNFTTYLPPLIPLNRQVRYQVFLI